MGLFGRVWGERQAETYLRSIHAAASFVAEYPGTARSADRVRPGVSKYVVESHVLYMRIHRDRVDITRVLHKSMDASRHI